MEYDVAVIGAGPGGCATAYHLRQAGWKVLLVERRRYPVDKLCGEFLSPEGITSLRQMGLNLQDPNGYFPSIKTVGVSSLAGTVWQATLPEVGLGVSRKYLDHRLVERCAEVGVDVAQGVKVDRVEGSMDDGFSLAERGWSSWARLAVLACGKQNVLFNRLGVKGRAKGRWMALKLHHKGTFPQGLVELHNFQGGYAGLCNVEEGKVNLCLLTRTDRFRWAGGDCRNFVEQILWHNPLLAQRLKNMEGNWSEAVAVANLSFGPVQRVAGGVLLVGDAAGGISPLCGDGISMALRMGEIVGALAHVYLKGEMAAAQFLQRYEDQWRAEFRWRLKLGNILQVLLTRPWGTRSAVAVLRRFSTLGQSLVRATRGGGGV